MPITKVSEKVHGIAHMGKPWQRGIQAESGRRRVPDVEGMKRLWMVYIICDI